MSIRASRWILWLAFALMLPLPILLLGPGRVPAARLLMLGGISVAVMLAESARGAVGLAAGVFLGQAALYLALLWGAAHLLSRQLGRLSPRGLAAATLAAVAFAAALAASFEIYRTPYAATSPRASLLRVFQ